MQRKPRQRRPRQRQEQHVNEGSTAVTQPDTNITSSDTKLTVTNAWRSTQMHRLSTGLGVTTAIVGGTIGVQVLRP